MISENDIKKGATFFMAFNDGEKHLVARLDITDRDCVHSKLHAETTEGNALIGFGKFSCENVFLSRIDAENMAAELNA